MIKIYLRSALTNRYGSPHQVLAYSDTEEIFFQLQREWQTAGIVAQLRRAAKGDGIRFLKVIQLGPVRLETEMQVRIYKVKQNRNRVSVFCERAGMNITTFKKRKLKDRNENNIGQG